jgi:hypothetical protein
MRVLLVGVSKRLLSSSSSLRSVSEPGALRLASARALSGALGRAELAPRGVPGLRSEFARFWVSEERRVFRAAVLPLSVRGFLGVRAVRGSRGPGSRGPGSRGPRAVCDPDGASGVFGADALRREVIDPDGVLVPLELERFEPVRVDGIGCVVDCRVRGVDLNVKVGILEVGVVFSFSFFCPSSFSRALCCSLPVASS